MLVCGIQKLTLLDYPGRTACTIFTGGCNFRCPFCHNASLVLDVKGSERIVIVGPKGSVYLNEGVIIANRHIHLTPEYAQKNGINDGDYVDVIVDSIKATKFFDVQVRVRDDFNVEMHIDTDDANACAIKNGDKVRIIKKK